jgi:hypothetical protein
MSTKLILSASAMAMGAAGVAGTFAPHEVLRALGMPATGFAPLLMQLLAASLFAFAMMNWLARGSLIGGIYNRPLAVGNVAHFTIGALALVKGSMAGEGNVIVTAVYVAFAIAFGIVMMRSPVSATPPLAR